MDLLTYMSSDGTGGSLYKMRYKQVFLHIVDRVTCPHCKEKFTFPVTLDCGHTVCWACARKIGSKNEAGQRCCCCSKCGAESVMEGLWSRINRTLFEAAAVVHLVTAFLGKGGNTPEVRSVGDSDSGIIDLKSEFSLGTSCSISSMPLPPYMASTRELFIRMFLLTDGLGSEDKLSQRPFGSSDCSEREQWSEDWTSAQQSLSDSGGLCDPELPQHTALASIRAQILDLLKHLTSDGTPRSLYKTRYKRVLVDILEPFTCPHCKGILLVPVTLDCGHTVCWVCAEKISSKNDEGQRCCCCPKCGVESVTEDWCLKVNGTLSKSVNAVRQQAVVLWCVLRTLEACSYGASDNLTGDSQLECSVSSSFSIGTTYPPLDVLPKRELLDRMFLVNEGLESKRELSGCTENEQRYKNQASAWRAFSRFMRYFSRRMRDPELSKKAQRSYQGSQR